MGDYSITPIGQGIMPDYAAEFARKAELQNAYIKGKLDALIQQGLSHGNSRDDVSEMDALEGTDLERKNPYMEKGYKEKRIKEMKQQYLEFGLADGTKVESEEQAEKLAKAFVENEENKYTFYSTRTFVDKDEFKKQEKARKTRQKELKQLYRSQGASKKEAKEKAESQLILNEKLNNKKTLEFMNGYRDLFYEEDGTLSQEKIKSFVKGLMNTHTDENETDNYHMSLKERREQAVKWGCDDDILRHLCKAAGGDFEKDYTELMQAATIAGTTVMGLLIGNLFKAEATAGSMAHDVAGNAQTGAAGAAGAYAHAEVTHAGTGAGIGFGVGALASRLIKDPGGKEDKVYDAAKPEEPQVVINEDEENEESDTITSCEYSPDQVDASHDEVEETCTYTLKKGESLYDAVRDGYGLKSHKEIMKFVHALKDRYGYKYTDNCWQAKWEMPELFGKKFSCGVNVKGTLKPENYDKKGKAVAQKEFNRNTEHVEKKYYFIKNCKGEQVGEFYEDVEKRDAELQRLQEEENARVQSEVEKRQAEREAATAN